MMKHKNWHWTLALLLLAGLALSTTQCGRGGVSLIPERSEVWQRPQGKGDREVTQDTRAGQGDRVWTQLQGRALLKWPDLWVRLYDDTNLQMDVLTPTGVTLAVDMGTTLSGSVPKVGGYVMKTDSYAEIKKGVGTTVMVAYHPDTGFTLVRVFDGQAEVRNLTGDVQTEEVISVGEWALVRPAMPPEVFHRLEDMRRLARELGLWDVFHEVELDVEAGFGPSGSQVAPEDVDIVFVEETPVEPVSPMRTPTRTPTAYAQPCRPGVLYCENFDDGRADGWALDAGWRLEREGTNYHLSGQGHYWATLTDPMWDDYRVRFQLKLLRGFIHLNYRLRNDPWSRYFIAFHESLLSLDKQERDTFTSLARVEAWHALDLWHTVEIVGWRAHLQVYVDGKLELDYTDPNPLRLGGIAFETLEDSIALIDDVEVMAAGPEPSRPTPTWTPRPSAPEMRFWADRDCVLLDQCTMLRWEVDYAEAVYLDGNGVASYDSRQVCPGETTTYALSAVGPGGEAGQSVTITVPQVNFWADQYSIASGECTTLHWDVEGAQAVYLNGEGVAGHDSQSVCPETTRAFVLRVVSACGEREYPVEINVVQPQALPAPLQISPPDGSVFDHVPRTTTLEWEDVPHDPYTDITYCVEIDCYHCCGWDTWCTDVGETFYEVVCDDKTWYSFDFVGAQPGRWRVWAVESGQEGAKSGWWEFRYTQ